MSAALKPQGPEMIWPPEPEPPVAPDGRLVTPDQTVETFERYASVYDAWVIAGFTLFVDLARACSEVGLPVYSMEALKNFDTQMARFRAQAKTHEQFLKERAKELHRGPRAEEAKWRRAVDSVSALARDKLNFASQVRDRIAALDTSQRPMDSFEGVRALDLYAEAVTKVFGLAAPARQEIEIMEGNPMPIVRVPLDPAHFANADWRIEMYDKVVDYVRQRAPDLVGVAVIEFDLVSE